MSRPHDQVPQMMQRAFAYLKQGQLAAAEDAFGAILKVQPRNVDALNFSGVIAAQKKQLKRALRLFDAAIGVDRKNPGIFNNRGLALQALEQRTAALESFDRAIALKADHAAAHFNRGNVLKELARCDEALASYDRAIAINAAFAEAHYNKGVLLNDLERFDEALASYDRAIASRGNYADAFYNRGNVLRVLARLEQALSSFDRAIAARADHAEAYLNSGEVLQELKQMEAALASYEHALRIRAGYAKAHYNRGNVYRVMGDMDAAVACYERCIELEPDNADAHFNKAIGHLASGEFDAGWKAFEWRWQSMNGPARHQIKRFAEPQWVGDAPLAGTTLLLHWEQGLGDTIHFCRYARVLSDRGARVILLVQRPLVGLLGNLAGVSHLIPEGGQLPAFDRHCPLMSLPLVLKTRLETIPSAPRYLSAEPALIESWRARLGPKSQPRVGLVWYGNPGHSEDRHRSLALGELLRRLPAGFEYFSLQKELREVDEAALAANPIMATFPNQLDLENTAALIECLDVVVCVDTSIAHLSGALGQKTWLLLSADPDWRWLLNREDSPWYPSMRLYRQRELDDWSEVLGRIARDLTALVLRV